MASLFEKIRKAEQGMYDPTKRYALTNITDEVFEFQWNGVKVEAKPKETVELPQYLAYVAMNKLIDQMMMAAEKTKLDKIRETNPAYIAPNGAGMLGIPAAREKYEQLIIRELAPKVGNDAKLDIIRMKEQIEGDIKRSKEDIKPLDAIVVSKGEFAELTEKAPASLA